MNANSSTNNIIARIAGNNNIARIANNNRTNHLNNDAVSSAKEHTPMNAFKTIVTRAAALLGFAALAACAPRANAQVIVDDWVQPSHNTLVSAAANTTVLQIKLYNANDYAVSNVPVKVTFAVPGFPQPIVPGSLYTVTLSPQSMSAYEDKWINVAIPFVNPNQIDYLGRPLLAEIQVGGSTDTISFLDAAPSANVQIVQVTPTGQSNGADTFTVTFTNSGYAASSAMTATVTTYLYGDGNTGSFSQPVSIPALAAQGGSYTVKLTTQPTQGYSIHGTVQIGAGIPVNFTL